MHNGEFMKKEKIVKKINFFFKKLDVHMQSEREDIKKLTK